MKANELRSKTKDELIAELASTERELFSLRLQKNNGGSEANSAPCFHRFKQVRRKIARIKTVLNENKFFVVR